MPNPQDLSSYEFSENPYMALINGGQQSSGQPQQMPNLMQGASTQQPQAPQSETPQQAGMEPASVMGQAQAQEESQLAKGQNPDSIRNLIQATKALEQFIAESTEKSDIMIGRGIISAISRLIANRQEAMMPELE